MAVKLSDNGIDFEVSPENYTCRPGAAEGRTRAPGDLYYCNRNRKILSIPAQRPG